MFSRISSSASAEGLSHQRQKLKSGEYNVSEVAYERGFSNLSFFIRLYKKIRLYSQKGVITVK